MTILFQKSWTHRGIALFVAIVFTMTTLTGGLPQAFASTGVLNPASGVKAQTQLLKDLYAMPAELGSLVSFWEPPAGTSRRGFVVHIQDAHANPEAQRNISEILKFLSKKYPDLAIGIEGVAGPLHPEYLQFFREFPEAGRAVVEDLRQKGELGGAELFAWGKFQCPLGASQSFSGQDVEKAKPGDAVIPVRGVENAELYRENLKTYRELLFSRDEIQTCLTPLRARFQTEISRTLNAALRDFLSERDRRKEGRYAPDRVSGDPDLQAYVLYLKKEALQFLQIDLKDPLEQLRFPNLVRVILAGEVQKGLDNAKVREDWKNVLASLRAVATGDAEREFVRTLSSFGLEKGFLTEMQDGAPVPATVDAALYPRKLLEQLVPFTKKHSLSLADHEPFLKSLELTIFRAEVEAAGLLREMNSLEALLTEKLARTDIEKKLVRRLQVFHLFEKLLFLELTREEYERIEAERGDLEALVEGAPGLGNFLARAKHFYVTALQRDRVLMENTLALGAGTSKEPRKIVVLVTGGFHTGGIDALLQEQKVGYATLMPHISRTDRGELYQKVMAGDHADLSAYFKAKNPFSTKQEALFFKELLETAAPVLFEKYQIEPARVAATVAQAVKNHPVLSGAVEASSLAGDKKTSLRFTPRLLMPQNMAIAAPANTAEVSFLRSLTEDRSVGTFSAATVDFGTAKDLTLSIQITALPVLAPAVASARSEAREGERETQISTRIFPSTRRLAIVPYVKIMPVTIEDGGEGATYFNISLLPDSKLAIARRVKKGQDTSLAHISDLVLLDRTSKDRFELKRVLSQGSEQESFEDPRVMSLGTTLGLTYVSVAHHRNGNGTVQSEWHSKFVRFRDPHTGDLSAGTLLLGNPSGWSKNAFLVPLPGGRVALFDRAETPVDGKRGVQLYYFKNLEEALNPPAGYWEEHSVEAATIFKAGENYSHAGFHTLLDVPGKDYKLAVLHFARITDKKNYDTAIALLDPKTLQPLGDIPLLIHDSTTAVDHEGHPIEGIIYATGVEIEGNILRFYAGIDDKRIGLIEQPLDEILEAYARINGKPDLLGEPSAGRASPKDARRVISVEKSPQAGATRSEVRQQTALIAAVSAQQPMDRGLRLVNGGSIRIEKGRVIPFDGVLQGTRVGLKTILENIFSTSKVLSVSGTLRPYSSFDPFIRLDLRGLDVALKDGSPVGEIQVFKMTIGLPGSPNFADFYYLPSERAILCSMTEALKPVIKSRADGSRVEALIGTGAHPVEEPAPASFWEGWRGKNAYRAYREFVDPVLLEAVASVLALPEYQDKAHIVHADLFGGDGSFLKKLLGREDVLPENAVWETHLIERDAASLDAARQQLASRSVQVHRSDLSAGKKLSELIGRKLDLVTSEGGINLGVVDTGTAARVSREVFDALNPGGYFLVTGFTLSRLSAKDFESIGFEVINRSVPANLFSEAVPKQLYVLRKPLTSSVVRPMASETEERQLSSVRSEVREREEIEGTIFTPRPVAGQILQMSLKKKSAGEDEAQGETFHWDIPRDDFFADHFLKAREAATAFATELTQSYQGDFSVGKNKKLTDQGLLSWIFPEVEAKVFIEAVAKISKTQSENPVPEGMDPAEHPISQILSALEAGQEELVRRVQEAYEQDDTIPVPEDGSTAHDRASLAVKELIRLVADFVQIGYLAENGKDNLELIQELVNKKAAEYAAGFGAQAKMLTTTASYVLMKKEAQTTHELEKRELEQIRNVLFQSSSLSGPVEETWKQEAGSIIRGRFQSLEEELGRQGETLDAEMAAVADQSPDSFARVELAQRKQSFEQRKKAVAVRLRELITQLEQASDISKFLLAIRTDLKILEFVMKADQKYIEEHGDAADRSSAAEGKQGIYGSFPPALNERAQKETQRKSGQSILRLLYDDFFMRVLRIRLPMGKQRGSQGFTNSTDSGKTGQDLVREVMKALQETTEPIEEGVPGTEASYILVVPTDTSDRDISRIMERYGHQIKGILGIGATPQTHWVVLIRGRAYVPQILLVPAAQEGKLTQLHGNKALLMPQQDRKGVLILDPNLEDLAAERKKADDYKKLQKAQGRIKNIPSSVPIAVNLEALSAVPSIQGGNLPGLIRTDVVAPENFQPLARSIAMNTLDVRRWLQGFQKRSEMRTAGPDDIMERFAKLDPEGAGNAEAIHALLKFWATPFEQILSQKTFAGNDVPLRTLDLQRDSKNRAALQMLETLVAEHPASTLRKEPSKPINGFDFYENSSFGELVLVLQLAAMIVAAQRAGRTLAEPERGRLVPLFPLIKTHAQFEWIRKELWPLAQQVALWEIVTGSGATPTEIEHAEKDIKKIGEETRFGIMVEYMSLLTGPEMDLFLKDPFIVRLNVGNNDLMKDYWLTRGVDVDRENAAAAFLLDQLESDLMAGLGDLIRRAQENGKKVCFCGGMAEVDKFLLAAEWWRRKFGVKDLAAKDSPFSVSVTGDAVARVNHALQVFRAISDGQLNEVFGAAEGWDLLDGRARELAGRYLSVSETVSILVEEWQERYENAGFHHALYRLSIDPGKGIGGNSEFVFLKGLIRTWLANDPEDLAALRLSDGDTVTRDEIQRILQYLADRGMMIPANIEKVLQAFDFIQSVLEVYQDLQGTDPDKFSGNLYPAIMGEVINAWEKKYGRPEWLSEGRSERDDAVTGAKKEEQRVNDFYRYYHDHAARIFYTVRRTLNEIDAFLIRPVYTYGENDGKLEEFIAWDGKPSWIIGQTRYGLTMSRERGRKGEAGYYIHVDHALENFRKNPALMLKVFMLAAEKNAFISHRTQRAMEILQLEGESSAQEKSSRSEMRAAGEAGWQDAFNSSFGKLLAMDADIIYPMWRMEEFGFLNQSLPYFNKLNRYSLKDGTIFPLQMQALQALETLERLHTKETGSVYQRAAGVFRTLRSNPEAARLTRLAVLLHPIVETEVGDGFTMEGVRRVTRDFLKVLNMDNDSLREKLVWLLFQQHRFARQGFLTEDDILKTVSEVIRSKGVTPDLLSTLYAVAFAKQASEANPESRIMLPRQGADSPLADLDRFFVAGMKMLADRKLSPQVALREADQDVIWGGRGEVLAQLKDFAGNRDWRNILEDYLANTQGGNDAALRELLVRTVETPDLFDALFGQFSKRTSTYYMRTMDPGSLLKQLFFYRHLLYLRETGDRTTRATAFFPLPHQYNQAYEVIAGAAFEESGDAALDARVLYENGFFVENAAIRNPPGQPAFIRYLGFFPHGEDMALVRKKITSEVEKIFARIGAGDKVWRAFKSNVEIRFDRADEVYGKPIHVDKRDAWIGPETTAKFTPNIPYQDKTVSVLTVHVASSDWRGQLLVLLTTLALTYGCDIEDLQFEHLKGFPPGTQVYITKNGKALTPALKASIEKSVARTLDMKPITFQGKEAVAENPGEKLEKVARNLKIHPWTQLHSRPAAQLVKLINESNVENAFLRAGDREINLHSITAVLAAGITGGTDVTIVLEGRNRAKLEELMDRIETEVIGRRGDGEETILLFQRSEIRAQVERKYTVSNEQGIHARPAALIKRAGELFPDLAIVVEKDDEQFDGKKIMDLMMMAAEKGSVLKIIVKGPEGKKALIEQYFQELARIEDDGAKVFNILPRSELRLPATGLAGGIMALAAGRPLSKQQKAKVLRQAQKEKRSEVRAQVEREYKIVNKLGIYIQPAILIQKIGAQFPALKIEIAKGRERVNGKGLMSLMMMSARQDSVLRFIVSGPDTALIEQYFQGIENIRDSSTGGQVFKALPHVEREYRVITPNGVHVRPSQAIQEAGELFRDLEIEIEKDGERADGRNWESIMDLTAGKGAVLKFIIKNPEGKEALIEQYFQRLEKIEDPRETYHQKIFEMIPREETRGQAQEGKRSEIRAEEKILDVTTMAPEALGNFSALVEQRPLDDGQPVSLGLLTDPYEIPVALPGSGATGRRDFLKTAGAAGLLGALWLALGGATTLAGQVRKPAAPAKPAPVDAVSQALRVMNQVRYTASLEPLQFSDWNGIKGNMIATVLGELNSFTEQWNKMPKQGVAPEKLGEIHRTFFLNLAKQINSGTKLPEGYGLDYLRAVARLIHKDLPQFFAAQGLAFSGTGTAVETLTVQMTRGGQVVRSQDYFYPTLTMPDKYFLVLKANARRDLKVPPQVLGDERTPLILVQPVRVQIGGGQVQFAPYAEQWREGQINELGFADGATAFLRADLIEQALKYDRATLGKIDLGFLAEDYSLKDITTGIRVGEPTVSQGKETVKVVSIPITNLSAAAGYAAMKLMVAVMRSMDKGKAVFDFGLWQLARYLETAKHEITHVNDSHRDVWRILWQLSQPASDHRVVQEDMNSAEVLIEQNACLEAFKKMPAVFLIDLLATMQTEGRPVSNFDKAPAEILTAVAKELNRDPARYGIVIDAGLKLGRSIQITAQFYRIVEKSDRVEALYAAARKALNIDARAQVLSRKYASLDPGAQSAARSEIRDMEKYPIFLGGFMDPEYTAKMGIAFFTLLKESLTSKGLTVVSTLDPESTPPAVAVLRLNGSSTEGNIRRLKDKNPNVKIILTTAGAASFTPAELQAMGADKLLNLSFGISELYKTILAFIQLVEAAPQAPVPAAAPVMDPSSRYQPMTGEDGALIEKLFGKLEPWQAKDLRRRLLRDTQTGHLYLAKYETDPNPLEAKRFIWPTKDNRERQLLMTELFRRLEGNAVDTVIPETAERERVGRFLGLTPEKAATIHLVSLASNYKLDDGVIRQRDFNRAMTRHFVLAIFTRWYDYHTGNHGALSDASIPITFDQEQALHPDLVSIEEFTHRFIPNYFGNISFEQMLSMLDLEELARSAEAVRHMDLAGFRADFGKKYATAGVFDRQSYDSHFSNLAIWQKSFDADIKRFFEILFTSGLQGFALRAADSKPLPTQAQILAAVTPHFDQATPGRSEIRTPEEPLQAFEALRAKLLEQDRKFFDKLKQTNSPLDPPKIRRKMAHTWKPTLYFRDFRELFGSLDALRNAALRDTALNPSRIQSLGMIMNKIFSRFETQGYRGAITDKKALTPLHDALENWSMGWYKPAPFRGDSNEVAILHNQAIQQYIRKEADAWIIGMMRFIEITPRYQTGFLELVRTFPEAVREWSLDPWKTSGDKKKSPEYIMNILNGWHKFGRSETGELKDLYPPERKRAGEDHIGTQRRREIFLFSEGLFFMTQAARGFQPYQMELPFGPAKPQRSELRGPTVEARNQLVVSDKTFIFDTPELPQDAVIDAANAVETIFSVPGIAFYLPEQVSVTVEGRQVTLSRMEAAQGWVTGQMTQKVLTQAATSGISNERLEKVLEAFQKALPIGITLPSGTLLEGPQVHVHLTDLTENDRSALVTHFAVVLGALVSLRGRLLINIGTDSKTAQNIGEKIRALAKREGIMLAPDQFKIVSSRQEDPFLLKGAKKVDALVARSSGSFDPVSYQQGIGSRWVTEDAGDMKTLAAALTTVLYAALDKQWETDRFNIHKPSEYDHGTLLATVLQAIQGYLQIRTAA